ncbi:hypothetical protein AHAS_Ahas09G0167500 [Arachis hypogaea]
MAEPIRITLKEAGAPDFTLQPYQARHPNLGADFELKTALINLLPKFYDRDASRSPPHSLVITRHARERYPHPYKACFVPLSNRCGTLQLVLISYFCQSMKPQDKTLLDAASNGSLTKYKMVTKAWQLITDLAESTRNASQRTKHPKVGEIIPTKDGGITTIKKAETTVEIKGEITITINKTGINRIPHTEHLTKDKAKHLNQTNHKPLKSPTPPPLPTKMKHSELFFNEKSPSKLN